MKLKLCLLLLSAVCISLIINFSSTIIETAENKADSVDEITAISPNNSDKEEFAKQMFFEIRHVENPAEKAVLYRKITDECSGIALAQEALWKLSELYLNDFDEPNIKESIGCLENFLELFPDSEWRSHVEISLLGLYENEKAWNKVVILCEKILKEDSNMPRNLKEELIKRQNTAKNRVKTG
ncbi:MAG: hypothetical protein FWF87_02840 [Synergistaceae bacterium]|nr:hypothetical protein [Synergistaceae bacterium]